MKADTSWIVPFLGDLKEFAEDNGMHAFSEDLGNLIEAYGEELCKGSQYPPREDGTDGIDVGNLIVSGRLGRKAH